MSQRGCEPTVNGEGQVLLPQLSEQNIVPGEDPFTQGQIAAMRKEEINVNDDNKPALENVPGVIIPAEETGVHYSE